MVLEVLDDNKNGLIPKKEVQEAVKKIVFQNNLDIENEALTQIIDSLYVDS